jgi:membrane-bound ClpP family serine protease
MKFRHFITLLVFILVALPALATRPKIGRGIGPGVNDGAGNTTGSSTTEITMPVGVAVDGANANSTSAAEKPEANIVYTVDLGNETGAASVNQTHSALEKARSMNAACVLIRINSFAGGWDDAENIRQEIQGFEKPVMILVNNNSVSPSAFVSSAGDSVFKSGRSTVITNKKATAIHSKRINPDSKANDVKVNPATKDITPSAHEEEEYVASDATFNEVLYKAGLSNLTVVHHAPGIAEKLAHFLVQPWIAALLLLITGLVLRYSSRKKLPGPALYLLFAVSALCIAPFHFAGLMNNPELAGTIISIVAVIAGLKTRLVWLQIASFAALILFLSLARVNGTVSITESVTTSEFGIAALLSCALLTLGMLSDWGIQKFSVRSARG